MKEGAHGVGRMVVLPTPAWERLQGAGALFEIEPSLPFKGRLCEQAKVFFYDAAENALFADMSQVLRSS